MRTKRLNILKLEVEFLHLKYILLIGQLEHKIFNANKWRIHSKCLTNVRIF